MGESARIEALVKQRRGAGIDIVVNDEVWMTVHRETVLEAGVRKGDPATEDLRQRLTVADAERQAYQAALSLLSYRARSEQELRQRLQRKGIAADAIQTAIDRLHRSGLIDDAHFASAWVESRGSGSSGHGSPLLAAELRSRGIDADSITAALESTDDHALALAAARARLSRLRGLDYAGFRRRLGGFLQRRGFGYDVTNATVRTLWQEAGGPSRSDDDAQ